MERITKHMDKATIFGILGYTAYTGFLSATLTCLAPCQYMLWAAWNKRIHHV